MPEPLKRLDSEDVLTSIRRLVSEMTASDDPPPRPAPLLLTPAFRVAESAADVAPAEDTAADNTTDEETAGEDTTGEDGIDYGICDDPRPAADSAEPSLGDIVTGLGAAIGNPPGEFEPDGSEEQTFATSAALARGDDTGPAVQQAADAAPATNGATHELATPGEHMLDEALIDEDSLREIVTDLVRQELRGELGERMTRNIRRLIRQEINRALTLRDLEGNG